MHAQCNIARTVSSVTNAQVMYYDRNYHKFSKQFRVAIHDYRVL